MINAPIMQATNVAGKEQAMIWINETFAPDKIERSEAVAAAIGLAVTACCDAITAIDIGRSGLIPAPLAISAIAGKIA